MQEEMQGAPAALYSMACARTALTNFQRPCRIFALKVLSERAVFGAMAAAQYLQDLKAELQVLLAAKGQQLQADLSAVEAPVADLNDRMQDTMDRLSRQVSL